MTELIIAGDTKNRSKGKFPSMLPEVSTFVICGEIFQFIYHLGGLMLIAGK